MYHFRPISVISSYKNAYPDEKMIVSRHTIDKLVKKIVLLDISYSKDVIENTLHYLVSEQYKNGEIDVAEMNHLHLIITQRLDQVYDDFKTYPYGRCCLLFL